MGISLTDAFRNIGNKIAYQLEISGTFLSKGVEDALKAKGWQIDYEYPAFTPASVMAAPVMPSLAVRDRNGVSLHDLPPARRAAFDADLREAAAQRWLNTGPKPPLL